MNPLLTKVGFWFFCFVFLWERLRAPGAEGRCSPADPAGAQHPVRGLLERVQAGRGCAAREQGSKETHVIALQRASNSPDNMVTVFLKPLTPPTGPLRALHLVLSSVLPIRWWLEAELLPPDLAVLVQVSPSSSVQSQTLRLSVRTVRSLPFRLHALHRWAMKHHGNLSSLVHTTQGNRVYVHLGEDPTLPAVCQLQPSFLFPNYMTSDLQPQTVKGCSYPRGSEASPEVHVIRLRSAGSWISGSLQADVTVSLVPPVATSEPQRVVLILSSSVPINWVITATGVRGHVSVHSSSSVSLPFPPEPNLTMSSRLLPEPPAGSDPLVWATESSYADVRSYTEAELANRFVIRLAEGGTNQERLPVVNCDGGLLSVTVDLQKLKSLSLPAVAMTLRDQRCQAVSNGSHFLLALPIIFCGTEGILQEQPRGVLYKNMLLLWRARPQGVAAQGGNRKSGPPFSIHISCFASSPSKSAANDDNVTLPLIGRFARGAQRGPELAPTPDRLPVPILTLGPALQLRLFVTDSYKRTWTGPCVITADHHVFVEISAKASLADVVQVESCFVSPQSDPKKSPFWTVISNGCSSDPSVRLGAKAGGDEAEDAYHGEEEEDVGREGDRGDHRRRRFSAKDDGLPNVGDSEKTQLLRFSFVLRPVFNESMQFLHCSLLLCLSDSAKEEAIQEANRCQSGVPIPPLVLGSSKHQVRCVVNSSLCPAYPHQCEIRNLSRPMVVTRPISSLLTKLEPSAGQRTESLSPESSRFVLHEGLLMGIVFTAFLVGVSLMGGLWCIYTYTGRGHPESFRNAHLNQTQEGCNNRTPPPFLSDQSSSSV